MARETRKSNETETLRPAKVFSFWLRSTIFTTELMYPVEREITGRRKGYLRYPNWFLPNCIVPRNISRHISSGVFFVNQNNIFYFRLLHFKKSGAALLSYADTLSFIQWSTAQHIKKTIILQRSQWKDPPHT